MDYVDRVLIKRAKQGDLAAFTELVEQYKDRIYGFLYRYTGSREDAYDLSQEVFIKVFTHLESFDEKQRFSPWIFRIASNTAVDALRRRKQVVYLDEPVNNDEQLYMQIPSNGDTPETSLEYHDLKGSLEHVILALSPTYREPLLLRLTDNMSYDEISEILKIPISTVKTRIFRARDMLRNTLVAQGYLDQ